MGTCTNVGNLTADCNLNGVPSQCNKGICYSKDGTDLCKMFDYPCGRDATTTTPASTPAVTLAPPTVSCTKPCNLKFALYGIENTTTSNIVNMTVGPAWNRIPAVCNLS